MSRCSSCSISDGLEGDLCYAQSEQKWQSSNHGGLTTRAGRKSTESASRQPGNTREQCSGVGTKREPGGWCNSINVSEHVVSKGPEILPDFDATKDKVYESQIDS